MSQSDAPENAAIAPFVLILMKFLMPEAREEEGTTLGLKTIRKRIPLFLSDWSSWIPALLVLVLNLDIGLILESIFLLR